MISFVWSADNPFMAGAGGSENYTAGQIRELQKRGIPVRIVTIGYGHKDGRADFPDIPFKALVSKRQLSLLNDTLVFVTYPLNVRTKRPSYAILHCPPASCGLADPLFNKRGVPGKQMIAASRFSATMWEQELGLEHHSIPVAYPAADDSFRSVKRPSYHGRKARVLFSGRLHPDKGIYTLLAAMHILKKSRAPIELTVTTAGAHTDDGKIVKTILDAHPWIKVVPAGRTAQEMANLMAKQDVVVMPSTNIFWKELFGMVSIEAQHAGCRVVASRAGGLPETDCGGLMLVEPDNPKALAEGMLRAAKLGRLRNQERRRASNVFTIEESVDSLLDILGEEVESPSLLTGLSGKRNTPLLQSD